MSERNRTIRLTDAEQAALRPQLRTLTAPAAALADAVICQDVFAAAPHLPPGSADLLVADPPYNLRKDFDGEPFHRRSDDEYADFTAAWLAAVWPALKPTASVYVCCDWRCGAAVERVLRERLTVRNRITWEREKGRGAKTNWKNASEDIWFATVGKEYWFDVEAVKTRRPVVAPYREAGQPKDWRQTTAGPVRLTHPANLWTDLTVPFWSMPENTEHPTQKPEKLMARLILASCPPGGLVLDPFAGVGTSAVAARKLGRRFIAVERSERYACLALKRLAAAAPGDRIQGYVNGAFEPRNSPRNA